MNKVLISVAKYIRDLLSHDEQLIKIGRSDEELENSTDNYIAVDALGPAQRLTQGKKFDGDAEVMMHSVKYRQEITLSFYGVDAYDLANDFILMQSDQLSYDLQNQLQITVLKADSIIDVKLLSSDTYVNRLDVSFSLLYNKQKEISTRRIDELQYTLIENK